MRNSALLIPTINKGNFLLLKFWGEKKGVVVGFLLRFVVLRDWRGAAAGLESRPPEFEGIVWAESSMLEKLFVNLAPVSIRLEWHMLFSKTLFHNLLLAKRGI